MIYGIGIDLVENDRIEKIIRKWGPKFLSRVFTDAEIEYCGRHAQSSLHYGARFAVKESFLKAIGTGLGGGVKLAEIEVANLKSGKPGLRLSGGARAFVEQAGIQKIHLSITHTKHYASAAVLLEKELPDGGFADKT
ncbi:MAG: holo-ACP synthase [Smithellaceae bacterium]|jgi:holo-[acyl-carrier protein] synthase|nr:holo-ACP synthase [Smithellaceae bacterium]MDD3258022.1 holo-ACP synthase [Smithellaceae bacterium]MDD3848119.1 holo-ACP synthase [Smithellaceae bacterium]HOG11808.1 holo-ACP synthase [Smithellaceae bacterium]HOQ72525.1 holo-ACP synthase [Smithellaceae bacterium]